MVRLRLIQGWMRRLCVCAALWGISAMAAGQAPDLGVVRAHSHNDYTRKQPLSGALEAGFESIEVDVWFRHGRIVVSHYPVGSKGTLQELYLDPLRRRVAEAGAVSAAVQPLMLWIDLKQDKPRLVEALRETLGAYPDLLSGPSAPVQVILTGKDAGKKAFFVGNKPVEGVTRDSNFYSDQDDSADEVWQYYALKWSRYLEWSGEADITGAERDELVRILESAHKKGRGVRFYGGPDNERVWKTLLECGVDFLHTDRVEDVAEFLEVHRVDEDG